MTLNSVVIRGVAVGTMVSGAILFAMQSGLLGGTAEAQAEFIPNTPAAGVYIPNTTPPGQLVLNGGSNAAQALTITYTRPPSVDLPETPQAPPAVQVAEAPSTGPSAPEIAADSPRLAFGQVPPGADVTLPAAPAPVASAPQPEALIVPASLDGEGGVIAAPQTDLAPQTDAELSPLGLPCDITVTATAMPAAMVALDVMAPCRPGAEITITHSGLSFDAELDAFGLMMLDIPAFETPAFFSVRFADGIEETTLVGLPDLRDYDRIGVTWDGAAELELHAMEFGAKFGEPGHVWHEAPASQEAAMGGTGGFLTIVEANDTYAQVYTIPRAAMAEGRGVEMGLDVPVTAASCATDVMAHTLRAEGGGPVQLRELTFTMPACDAVGDYLVLQNLLDDLRLAASN